MQFYSRHNIKWLRIIMEIKYNWDMDVAMVCGNIRRDKIINENIIKKCWSRIYSRKDDEK